MAIPRCAINDEKLTIDNAWVVWPRTQGRPKNPFTDQNARIVCKRCADSVAGPRKAVTGNAADDQAPDQMAKLDTWDVPEMREDNARGYGNPRWYGGR